MALSMRERLGLQKQVKTNLAALRGGELGMRDRLRVQKDVKADIAKLKGVADDQRPASPPIDPREVSPGDPVVWRNEMGEIYGNYRGLTDDNQRAVIVHDGGQQSAAPRNEVYPADSREVTADDMPARVQNAFDKLLQPLLEVAQELREARERDAQEYAGSEFAGDLLASPDVQRRIADADQAIQERISRIQEPAVVKAAQAYVDARRPDLSLNEGEQAVRDAGQKDPAPLKQAVNGAGGDDAGGDSEGGEEEELHYSDLILQALVEHHGWSQAETSQGMTAEKDVGGQFGGEINPDGARLVTAQFEGERRRYLQLVAGFDKPVTVDGRPALSGDDADVRAVAADFNSQVTEWAVENAADPGTLKVAPNRTPEQPDTLTTQAAEGNFNDLPLPGFIEKLKDAYSADEDLEGAKVAAAGYLEANREYLEEAA